MILRRKSDAEEFALSIEGTEGGGYESGAFRAPDSTRCVALRKAKGDARRITVIESSPKSQAQPLVQTFDYLKPGDRIPVSKPQLLSVIGTRCQSGTTRPPNHGALRRSAGPRIPRDSPFSTISATIKRHDSSTWTQRPAKPIIDEQISIIIYYYNL